MKCNYLPSLNFVCVCGNTGLSGAPQFPIKRGFLEGSQASPFCPSLKRNLYMKMSMEHWWNDTERGKQKYWEENLF